MPENATKKLIPCGSRAAALQASSLSLTTSYLARKPRSTGVQYATVFRSYSRHCALQDIPLFPITMEMVCLWLHAGGTNISSRTSVLEQLRLETAAVWQESAGVVGGKLGKFKEIEELRRMRDPRSSAHEFLLSLELQTDARFAERKEHKQSAKTSNGGFHDVRWSLTLSVQC